MVPNAPILSFRSFDKMIHSFPTDDDVTCSFSVDDQIDGVYYNGKQLNVTGDLYGWFNGNTFTFTADAYGFGTLVIKGTDHNTNMDHCVYGGLLLHCKAKNVNSPWHNFKSDLKHWKAQDDSDLCADHVDPNDPKIYRLPYFMRKLIKSGSTNIWTSMQKVILVGSPGNT